MTSHWLVSALLLVTCSLTLASDPSPLQDFCVADAESAVLVNGVVCKDPKRVQADDFLFRGLHLMGNTTNDVGSNVTAVTVAELPGLNTFGISMARIDFAPWGINPPHTHPRATEVLTVIEGRILVGFVTSNPENRLITKRLEKGDVFVFPQGLIHFQQNVGNGYALAVAGLSSQNPGVITIANAVFGSDPDIAGDFLQKPFKLTSRSFSRFNQNSEILHGNGYALAIAGLSSQNPGVITIANAVFGSNPDIAGDILAKAFKVDIKVVQQIQSKF